MAAAGGDDQGIGEAFEKPANGFGAFRWLVEKIQAKLKKGLACLSFAPGVLQQGRNVRQA